MPHDWATCVLALCLVLFTASPTLAGTWSRPTLANAQADCDFAFTGPINPGDLLAILDDPDWIGSPRKRVCFDSPGGSFKEVYDFVTRGGTPDYDFATRIRSGARCESACAILFMFGQTWHGDWALPDRSMEPGARLGFHAPSLVGDAAEAASAQAAFDVALDVARLLFDESYTHATSSGGSLPSELVALVLRTPGDELYYVETVGEMQLLGIWSTADQDRTVRIGANRAEVGALATRVCVSSYAFAFRHHLVTGGYDFSELSEFVERALAKSSDIVLEEIVEVPGDDFNPPRIVVFLTGGPFLRQGQGGPSAATRLYCRAELHTAENAGFYDVDRALVSYGLATTLLFGTLPEWNNDYDVRPVGLVPIDTEH